MQGAFDCHCLIRLARTILAEAGAWAAMITFFTPFRVLVFTLPVFACAPMPEPMRQLPPAPVAGAWPQLLPQEAFGPPIPPPSPAADLAAEAAALRRRADILRAQQP